MVIETHNLTKKFKNQTAVDSLNIHIDKGDIYCLAGKDGAGKTTLLKMIMGTLSPDYGKLFLFENEKRSVSGQKIGVLTDRPALFLNQSAYENIIRYAIISDIKNDIDSEIDRVLDIVDLNNTGMTKVKYFSEGMKQRLGIAIALIGNPELLILDELPNGLYPVGIDVIKVLMTELNKKGITIFFSCHIIEELAKTATKYGIMREGKLIEEISADEINERCKSVTALEVDSLQEAIKIINLRYDHLYFSENKIIYLHKMSDEQTTELVKELKKSGINITNVFSVKITLEQYFANEVESYNEQID